MYFFCNSFAFMELHLAAITVLLTWWNIQYLIYMQCYVSIESFIFNALIMDLGCYFIWFSISPYLFHDFFLINFTCKCSPFPSYDLIHLWMEMTWHMTLTSLWHTSKLLSHFVVQLISNSLCGSSLPSLLCLFVCLNMHPCFIKYLFFVVPIFQGRSLLRLE